MALSGSVLSNLIKSELQPEFNGTQLDNFCNALGNGIITSVTGFLTFTTSDLGLPLGSGTGIGSGILGLSNSTISADIFSKGQTFWSAYQNDGPGKKWEDICNAVGISVKSHFSSAAILTSVHTPVLNGTGTVITYSGVTISAMKTAIVNAAPSSWSAPGARFPELAEAVATGVVTELTGHIPVDIIIIGAGAAGPTVGTGTGIVT